MRPSIITSAVVRVVIVEIVQQRRASIPDLRHIDNKAATYVFAGEFCGIVEFLDVAVLPVDPDFAFEGVDQPTEAHAAFDPLDHLFA